MTFPIADTYENLTYGFEFEFIGMSDPESLRHFEQVMHHLNVPYQFTGKYGQNEDDAWVLGADGSVGDFDTEKTLGGNFGFELVSPVLTLKDFSVIGKVLNAVKSCLSGYVNDTCGTHVHVGGLSFMRRGDYTGNESFTRGNCAVWLFSKLQPYLWNPLVHINRANNKYCARYEEGTYETDKYLALSSSGFMTYVKHPTMECRLHHGTLDVEEITEWAQVVSRFLWFCFHENPRVHLDISESPDRIALSLLSQFHVPEALSKRLITRMGEYHGE